MSKRTNFFIRTDEEVNDLDYGDGFRDGIYASLIVVILFYIVLFFTSCSTPTPILTNEPESTWGGTGGYIIIDTGGLFTYDSIPWTYHVDSTHSLQDTIITDTYVLLLGDVEEGVSTTIRVKRRDYRSAGFVYKREYFMYNDNLRIMKDALPKYSRLGCLADITRRFFLPDTPVFTDDMYYYIPNEYILLDFDTIVNYDK